MRMSQRNVLESVGAAVVSGIRIWKAKAPTARRTQKLNNDSIKKVWARPHTDNSN